MRPSTVATGLAAQSSALPPTRRPLSLLPYAPYFFSTLYPSDTASVVLSLLAYPCSSAVPYR